ncbi:hypothetical protein [Pontibacter silvestris]|nr:hypothetical protein [Pontibacter silvestris]
MGQVYINYTMYKIDQASLKPDERPEIAYQQSRHRKKAILFHVERMA